MVIRQVRRTYYLGRKNETLLSFTFDKTIELIIYPLLKTTNKVK